MLDLFFTSDHHFGHKLMVGKRGFESKEEMNEALIAAWNDKVTKKSIVYHLGDFSFLNGDETNKIISRLNGSICLIRGNHDKQVSTLFDSVDLMKEIKVGSQTIVMCHYAMLAWNKKHYGSLHLFGHSHGRLGKCEPLSMDVGVDTREDWQPYSLKEIYDIFNKEQ